MAYFYDFMKSDEYWMHFALQEAKQALREDEIPIGAVLVRKNEIIASAHNQTKRNPLAHAEKLTIEKALTHADKFLDDCTLYCTIEPCAMCAGIIIWARLERIVFGAYDEKAGACGSLYHLLFDKRINHNPQVTSGILAEECRDLIQSFFQEKRAAVKKNFTKKQDS
jgi:tRNA(adenine34) deaminase